MTFRSFLRSSSQLGRKQRRNCIEFLSRSFVLAASYFDFLRSPYSRTSSGFSQES
ncbi:hypothetical protein KFK09_020582 [Dendrobium nobile]|uniref:Uncharacterized protein n=1 Tax=Dendrobium nobile TaxID=94219 RepID=A0A8T3ALP8_DENNO|nr:hypothetical protein KFK09_020582 [Dendrobium nobile]